jgi:hypothetical protein
MEQRVVPDQYPRWVKLGSRKGKQSRTTLCGWFVIEVLLAVCLVGLTVQQMATGRMFYIFMAAWPAASAILLLASIRWIDKHGTWG